jgi:hypothetical protein
MGNGVSCGSGTKNVNNECVPSDITLACGSGTKNVNNECVPADNEFFDILQKYIVLEFGQQQKTKQDCESFGGKYTTGSSKIDPRTGFTGVTSGRCQMPRLESEDMIIMQQGLCGRKVKSDVKFCKHDYNRLWL